MTVCVSSFNPPARRRRRQTTSTHDSLSSTLASPYAYHTLHTYAARQRRTCQSSIQKSRDALTRKSLTLTGPADPPTAASAAARRHGSETAATPESRNALPLAETPPEVQTCWLLGSDMARTGARRGMAATMRSAPRCLIVSNHRAAILPCNTVRHVKHDKCMPCSKACLACTSAFSCPVVGRPITPSWWLPSWACAAT
jgi:hypothetical protein